MAGTFQFIMRNGPTPGATYPLEGDLISIGRDSTNTIQINDAEISRRHARLQFQGGKYVIEDLGSTNGTFINGQRLAAPYVLKQGDVVSFGEQIVLAYESSTFDPAATVATSHATVMSHQPPAAPPPPPAQAYSGQVATGPLSQPVKKINPLPIVVIAGVAVIICACLGFLFWVDANSMWCTFFPFLGGCP